MRDAYAHSVGLSIYLYLSHSESRNSLSLSVSVQHTRFVGQSVAAAGENEWPLGRDRIK